MISQIKHYSENKKLLDAHIQHMRSNSYYYDFLSSISGGDYALPINLHI